MGFKPDLRRPTGFLQCSDTVGLVILPVKFVPEMTYNVSSGTLSPTHSHTHSPSRRCTHTWVRSRLKSVWVNQGIRSKLPSCCR